MKYVDLYYKMRIYFFCALLILLAIGIVMIFIGIVVSEIKSRFEKRMKKDIDEAERGDSNEESL